MNSSLEELINRTLLDAIKIGIPEREFWEMTLGEIQREADGINFRHKQRLSEQAQMDYTQAIIFGRCIGSMLDSSCTIPSFEEAYPSLVDHEAVEKESSNKAVAQILAMAEAFNNRK